MCAARADLRQEFDLVYFDGSGFRLKPGAPYAWLLVEERFELPSASSKRLNVRGFLNLLTAFHSVVVQGPVDSEMVIRAFDAHCDLIEKPTLLILDNGEGQVGNRRWNSG